MARPKGSKNKKPGWFASSEGKSSEPQENSEESEGEEEAEAEEEVKPKAKPKKPVSQDAKKVPSRFQKYL